MPAFEANIYRRIKIAMITGWPMDYIDNKLGLLDGDAILQIWEAEQRLIKG